jgi:hypothetical protein
VPLLLGAKTQHEWLALSHLGKGALVTRAPVKAAQAVSLAGSSSVHAGLAGIVATLLVISTGIAVDRSQDVRPTGPEIAAPVPLVVNPASEVTPTPEAPVEVAGATDSEAPSADTVELAEAPRSAAPRKAAASPPPSSEASEPPPGPPPQPTGPPPPAAESPPPADQGTPPPPPPPPPLAQAKASVGSGATGLALGAGLQPNNPQPDLDLTLGTTPVIGDAPPAEGTNASVGGSLVPQPPLGAPLLAAGAPIGLS